MIIIESLGAVERRYSDLGMKLRQIETDTLWNDAINTIPFCFTYEETDIPCDPVEPSAKELLDIIVGEEAG